MGHEFKNLVGLYNGDASGWHLPDAPDGWDGGWREKLLGEPFRAKLTVDYRGSGGRFDIGIGLKYEPGATWAVKSVFFGLEPVFATYEIEVAGIWDTQLTLNRRVDVLKFVQTEGGPRDIGGNGFILAEWENSTFWGVNPVYYQGSIPSHETTIPEAPDRTYYEGIKRSNEPYFPIGKHNGDSFSVKFPFNYRGPGGQLKVAASPVYSGGATWATDIMTVAMSSEYVEYIAEVTGIFNTYERPFDHISVMKAIQTVDGPLNIDGGGMLAADPDHDVYFHASETAEVEIIDNDPSLPVYYDGRARPSFDKIAKQNGDTFTVKFPFRYRGPDINLKFGASPVYPPGPTWAQEISPVPATMDWKSYYSPLLSAIFNTSLRAGDEISVRRMITTEDGPLFLMNDKNTGSLPLSNEDAEVYYRTEEIDEHEIDLPDGTAYYDGIWQDVAEIDKRDGETWTARFTFKHKGVAGSVVAGVWLNDSFHTRADVVVPVTNDLTFKDYTIEVQGIWDGEGLDDGAGVDAIKFIETIDGVIIKSNPDDSVFYHREGTIPTYCTIDSDCADGYICMGGICVKDPNTNGGTSVVDWIKANALALSAGGAVLAGAIILTGKTKGGKVGK